MKPAAAASWAPKASQIVLSMAEVERNRAYARKAVIYQSISSCLHPELSIKTHSVCVVVGDIESNCYYYAKDTQEIKGDRPPSEIRKVVFLVVVHLADDAGHKGNQPPKLLE